ncbi:MAG: ribosome maturation factor, partial [Xanthobacteraceae bacterium]
RYAGHVAQVEMQAPVDGRRRFRGELVGTDGAFARIRHGDGAANANSEVLLPIDDMMEAKLVLTDALISQSLRKSKLNQRKGD